MAQNIHKINGGLFETGTHTVLKPLDFFLNIKNKKGKIMGSNSPPPPWDVEPKLINMIFLGGQNPNDDPCISIEQVMAIFVG